MHYFSAGYTSLGKVQLLFHIVYKHEIGGFRAMYDVRANDSAVSTAKYVWRVFSG